MRKIVFFFSLCAAFCVKGAQVDRLLTEYEKIQSVTCHIRRTVEGQSGNIRFISRIYWKNNNCLHVENLSPLPRRIIADGKTFFSYADGDPKGFSRPVDELSEEMLISLRKIPGTAMDHLLRLKNIPETPLSENRFAYDTEKNYVVVTLDELHRLARIDFFKSPNCAQKNATYEYSDFSEVLPDVWVPFKHTAVLYTQNHSSVNETVKIDRFFVNKPIAQSLFYPQTFFDNTVDFADSFSDIYK